MVKESLYDFMIGDIDPDLRPLVEDAVKFDKNIQSELAHLKQAQDYVESLSQIKVDMNVVEDVIEQSGIISEVSQKVAFERWPQSLKWGLEAVVVIAVMVSLLTVLPLEKVSEYMQQRDPQIILAEIDAKKDPSTLETADEPAQFVDEGAATTPSVVAQKEKSPPSATPTPTQTPAIAESQPTPKPSETPAQADKAVVPVDVAAEGKVSVGSLYRGDLAVTNVEVIGPKITEKIANLGGRKAGSVELGWKRTPGSLYYHFTIPEAKYEDLVSFLGTYGSPKIQKEKHPRVMPDGIIRLIITVEEADQ